MPFTGVEIISDVSCPLCGNKVVCKQWDSFDEAHTDWKYSCTSSDCKYHGWDEGSDY